MSLNLYLCVLVTAFLLSFKFLKSFQRSHKFLFWMIAISVLTEGIGWYSLTFENKIASWVFFIYQPLSFGLLSGYFRLILEGLRAKKVILILTPMIIIIIIVLYFLSVKYGLPRYYKFLVSAFLLTIYSVIYLRQLLSRELEKELSDNANFWIVVGILIFHSVSFLVMGLVNYIYKQNPELAKQVYSINHILNIIYYSLIAYGFYIQWKSTKSSLSS